MNPLYLYIAAIGLGFLKLGCESGNFFGEEGMYGVQCFPLVFIVLRDLSFHSILNTLFQNILLLF